MISILKKDSRAQPAMPAKSKMAVRGRGGQKKPKFDSELAKLIFPLNMVM